MQVLIVEDDPDIANLVALTLQVAYSDCTITLAADGGSGLSSFSIEHPDLVMLDVGLPDIDGFAVCRKIREVSTVPIIMLTARDKTEDKVSGLTSGADDYIVKPFTALEFLARVQAVLRRSYPQSDSEPEADLSTEPVKSASELEAPSTPSARIVEHLRIHPQGAEMSEVEQVAGISGMDFIRVVAKLIEEGKVRDHYPLLTLS